MKRTLEQVTGEILDLAAAHFKIPRTELKAEDDFFQKLGINSLQALDLLTRIEMHFGIQLPDYEIQGVSDFQVLAERVQARL
jgi:acyl carrier protein